MEDEVKSVENAWILSTRELLSWMEKILETRPFIAPVRREDRIIFSEIASARQVVLRPGLPMIAPRKFLFPPREILFHYSSGEGSVFRTEAPSGENRVLFGVRSCDVHAIQVLDRIFLGDYEDPSYRARREATALVALNCSESGPNCFCASMGTGPFLNISDVPEGGGVDLILTELRDLYLLEATSDRGAELAALATLSEAREEDILSKSTAESILVEGMGKRLETDGLPALMRQGADHPIWKHKGEGRCLSCTNCTMVCPTCFCYHVEDRTSLDLERTERMRQWDSCQDPRFAEVHGANFRSTRAARLRQFVTHKLSTWLDQYDCFGCVGCGRCITWCPTGIDLTEIAAEIRKDLEP
jgi:ferredoxin